MQTKLWLIVKVFFFYYSSSGSISVSKKGKKKVKSGIHVKSSDSLRNHQRYPQALLRFKFAGSDLKFEKLDLNLFMSGELEIISGIRTEKSEKYGQIVIVKKNNVFEYSLRSEHTKGLLCWGVERYRNGCKTWKERLPALYYSVDFIFLFFGIMGFILEL